MPAWRRGALLERLALGGREERRELGGPRRRVLAEDVDQARPVHLVGESLGGLQHGKIRLASAVLLDALSARDPHVRPLTQSIAEGLDQRRLPHPGLAGHEDHRALSGHRHPEGVFEPMQLEAAADDEDKALRLDGGGGRGHLMRGGLDVRSRLSTGWREARLADSAPGLTVAIPCCRRR